MMVLAHGGGIGLVVWRNHVTIYGKKCVTFGFSPCLQVQDPRSLLFPLVWLLAVFLEPR